MVRNGRQYKVQSTGTVTRRRLINRYHGLRRYDLVDSPTNAPKARVDGKTNRAGRVLAAGDCRSTTRQTTLVLRLSVKYRHSSRMTVNDPAT